MKRVRRIDRSCRGSVMSEPLRAIVIEDKYLLAETLVDVLRKLGCQILGSAGSVGDAMNLVADSSCDFALVDLSLKGEWAFSVLDRLQDRGIPFLLATGAFIDDIPARHVAAIRVSKPYDMHDIRRALCLMASESGLRPCPEFLDPAQVVLPRQD